MRYTFADLEKLLETEPAKYRVEVERLRLEDPERLDRFIDWLRRTLANAPPREERPMSQTEVSELVEHTASALGWSKQRVMAEAMLRLHAIALHGEFKAFTSDEPAPTTAKKPPMRRHSSIRALVLGQLTKCPRVRQ